MFKTLSHRYLLPALAIALAETPNNVASPLEPNQISDLVVFGDSYSDVRAVNDGITPWPVYASSYANTTLHPYARSGAICSSTLTPRPGYPSLVDDEIPLFLNEYQNGTLGDLDMDKTLFSLWIGTNDLGVGTLLTEELDASLVEVTDCMVSWVKMLYDSGARNFLFQNVSDNVVYVSSPTKSLTHLI